MRFGEIRAANYPMAHPPRLIPCPDCRMPAAQVIDGALVFTVRHHGEKHRCILPLEKLTKLLTANDKSVLSSALTPISLDPASS